MVYNTKIVRSLDKPVLQLILNFFYPVGMITEKENLDIFKRQIYNYINIRNK